MIVKTFKLLKGSKIQIDYSKLSSDGENFNDYSEKCSEAAAPSFSQSLQDLTPHFCEICEFPQTDLTDFSVTGVHFSRVGEDDTLGFTMTGLRRLLTSETALTIQSPIKYIAKAGEGITETQICTEKCTNIVLDFLEECKKYVNGERLQVDNKIDGK